MKFVFVDKNSIETDIITDILAEEHIQYKVLEQHTMVMSMPFMATEIVTYNIEVNTSLEYFDFINELVNEKIRNYTDLEAFYRMPSYRKNRKSRIKKEVTELQ